MSLIIDEMLRFGASVRGPHHVKMKIKNQDAWCGYKNRLATMIAVCDGLGSRPFSDQGARAACGAAIDAVRIWAKFPNAALDFLPRLIKTLWEIRLADLNPNDCATTCLVACLTSSGRMVIAGLGDGIALIREPDGNLIHVVRRITEFTNQTQALGEPHRLSDWHIYELEHMSPGMAVLLATDGIADDLEPEKLSDFVAWLLHEFCDLKPIDRSRSLRKALYHWPTPMHQDDKTLAMLYYPFNSR